MAAELVTPKDTLTGIPLPILPQEVLPIHDPAQANQHHAWHPSSAPELLTPAGLALRHSRVQLVRSTDHNMGDKARGKLTYHDYFKGPELPTDENEIFRMCVLACAGYLPDRAIDLHHDEPRAVTMNKEQIAILQRAAVAVPLRLPAKMRLAQKAAIAYDGLINPGIGKAEYIQNTVEDFARRHRAQAGFGFRHLTYRYEPIRDFFQQYALRQELDYATEIDEFLCTDNAERKAYLGHWLLAQAIEEAADQVRPVYNAAFQAGRLHPAMPHKPHVLLKYKLGKREDRRQLTAALERQLKTRLKVA